MIQMEHKKKKRNSPYNVIVLVGIHDVRLEKFASISFNFAVL